MSGFYISNEGITPEELMINLKKYLFKTMPIFDKKYYEKVTYEFSINDFDLIKSVGKGHYGEVFLAKFKSGEDYALKIISKSKVVSEKAVRYVFNEKKLLQAVDFQFLVHMIFYFFDNSFIYFVLPYIKGGDVYTLLRERGRFDEDLSRFYSAQVCLAIEYLHLRDIIYRDIKPENLLISETGYLKLTDFGFAKLVTSGRTSTLCGTPEYLPPEMVLKKPYNHAVDWWSYGVLIYEMNSGFTPFKDISDMRTYFNITTGKFKMPYYFSDYLKDLINHLLQTDLTKRYGNLKDGVCDILNHKWFSTINWASVLNHRMKPRYIPDISPIDYTARASFHFPVSTSDAGYEQFKDL